jgi:hypothetical protein
VRSAATCGTPDLKRNPCGFEEDDGFAAIHTLSKQYQYSENRNEAALLRFIGFSESCVEVTKDGNANKISEECHQGYRCMN